MLCYRRKCVNLISSTAIVEMEGREHLKATESIMVINGALTKIFELATKKVAQIIDW